jgi:hypothetical protein
MPLRAIWKRKEGYFRLAEKVYLWLQAFLSALVFVFFPEVGRVGRAGNAAGRSVGSSPKDELQLFLDSLSK